jgi:hypothetical protein
MITRRDELGLNLRELVLELMGLVKMKPKTTQAPATLPMPFASLRYLGCPAPIHFLQLSQAG